MFVILEFYKCFSNKVLWIGSKYSYLTEEKNWKRRGKKEKVKDWIPLILHTGQLIHPFLVTKSLKTVCLLI